MKKFWIFSLLFFPLLASAHGIGQVFALPIPLKYYLGAAGLAVAFSFFVFAFLLSSEKQIEKKEKKFSTPWLAPVLLILKVIVSFVLLLTIATGIFGKEDASRNFAPTFFWIFFLIGFSILSLFFGNIWDKLNPWKILAGAVDIKAKEISAWVGVILLLGLYWFELASGYSFNPGVVGSVLIVYTLLNLIAGYLYYNWFSDGELFSVLFGFIGKLSFFRISDDNKSVIFTPLSHRLRMLSSYSALAVACVLLAGTSFDSFKETVLWFKLLHFFNYTGTLTLPNTLGIILSPLPFLFLYLLVIWIMQKLTNVSSVLILAKQLVFSLIPIAFGYTLAHSFSLIVVSVPKISGLISDPFGFGWNIFHTANLVNTNLILGAKAIWFIEIGFVVVAHIVGSLFAHILATDMMPNKKLVLKSQYPMVVLMVVFTITTLWLLSQPLVVNKVF